MTTTDGTPGLLGAAEHLATVLEQENAALSALDLAAASSLMDAKQRAADQFAEAQEGAKTPLAPGERDALRPIAARLRELGERNRILLERGLLVQQRVLGVIARAARTPPAAAGYGARGQVAARTGGAAVLMRSA